MALVKCKECAKEISSQAPSCPHCGAFRFAPPKKTSGCAIALAVLVGVPLLWVVYIYNKFSADYEANRSKPSPTVATPPKDAPATPQKDSAALLADFIAKGGAWEISERKDEMTSKSNIVLSTPSQSYGKDKFGRNVKATLIVQCQNNKTALVVALSDFISTHAVPVESRIDQQKAQSAQWQISTDYQGVFAPNAIARIKALENAEALTIRLTPHGESPMTFPFTVAGLATHLPKVRAACGW